MERLRVQKGVSMIETLEINKIHLGDSYELIKQIPDNSIDCIYTDVPYLYQKGGVGHSKLGQRMGKKKDEILNISDGIDYSILEDFVRVTKKINIYIWCSEMQIRPLLNWFYQNKGINGKFIFWGKTNPSPMTNQRWLPDTEICLYFRESGVVLNNNYEYKSTFFISSLNVDDKKQFNHPTIKPLNFVKKHLLHTTQENDVVLDCFSGSGTTCVAAKELNRQFIGIEIDKNYHKISVDRLNGINANGQTSIFTDFEKEYYHE